MSKHAPRRLRARALLVATGAAALSLTSGCPLPGQCMNCFSYDANNFGPFDLTPDPQIGPWDSGNSFGRLDMTTPVDGGAGDGGGDGGDGGR